ncbi:MAG: L,D-transpeptidase family protein [Alphaproteobacteria bacterium]|nr:L,D-transpeptidase family protein [Alphaproteobacteria bacterium]
MNLIVKNQHTALWKGRDMRCAVGRGGIVPASAKREGDGATPAGIWRMREVIYRADRVTLPRLVLPSRAMESDDGWCEAPEDVNYNRHVKRPYAASADHMWRGDSLYDVVAVLGYNDDPPVAGKGSAIFLHLARPDFSPSAGCVTLALDDLLAVLGEADIGTCVEIIAP